jgi:predicted anti-sigma-YlaC factor YlaD
MNDKHITEILDNASLAALSESELNGVRAHALECGSCRSAYEAARLSAVVLTSRAQATIEPSPFFQTRVMAAIREQREAESVPAFSRLWKSAKVLVSSMALATVALGVLSFVLPGTAISPDDPSLSAYSAESVIMGQSADEQISYEQVLSTIYEDDDDAR